MDLVVVARGVAPVLFQNVRDGSFRDAAADARLSVAADYTSVAAADVSKDGYTDFFLGRSDGPGVLAMSDGSGRFASSPAPAGTSGAVASQFVDYDNDGLLDLLVLTPQASHLFRNVGNAWVEGQTNGVAPAATPFQSMAVGDIDGDGDEDVVVALAGGELRVWRNDGGSTNRSLRSAGGSSQQPRWLEDRHAIRKPASTTRVVCGNAVSRTGRLRFDSATTTADAVRMLWPSGTLQTELDSDRPPVPQFVGQQRHRDRARSEAIVLPFSTPGTGRFEFVTDFMGGGELGTGRPERMEHGGSRRIRPDTRDQLQPRDGSDFASRTS
jgi:hypothetical protein